MSESFAASVVKVLDDLHLRSVLAESRCAEGYRLVYAALHDALLRDGLLDAGSSVSRQHYIDTGRYLTWQEVREL